MDAFLSLLCNEVFIAGVLGWFIAQSAKVVITSIKTKSFASERINGSGGMPSSHSCMVTAMTIATAMEEGVDSTFFAIAMIFAFVTLHDAMGVRWQAGLHARLLNKYMREWQEQNDLEEDEDDTPGDLKEFLGHRPIEVLVGVLLGILIAIAVCLLI
ncbi:MAG: divergent PAP2 family protein [Clostridia bacterium]|nr:divergent PAP2 family protein [Clostridia bacterium]